MVGTNQKINVEAFGTQYFNYRRPQRT